MPSLDQWGKQWKNDGHAVEQLLQTGWRTPHRANSDATIWFDALYESHRKSKSHLLRV